MAEPATESSWKGQVIDRLLVGKHSIVVLLMLVLVEVTGVELVGCRIRQGKYRRLVRVIRDLKVGVGATEQQGDPARVIDDVREIRKQLILGGTIMNRVGGACRVFNPEVVGIVASHNEIVKFSLRPARFETRVDRIMRTAVHGYLATVQIWPFLGLDIDDPSGVKAKLGR